MNELVIIKNGTFVADSLEVAEHFGKKHQHVLEKIDALLKEDVSKIRQMFQRQMYNDKYGRKQPRYFMNRNGFSLLAMRFTGKKALEWQLKYIEAFDLMEKALEKFTGYQAFRIDDKKHQRRTMSTLSQNLKKPVRVDFMKANTIADKAISNKYGYSKMIKKDAMSPEMLVDRQPVLESVTELMTIKDKYGIDISISKTVYGMVAQANTARIG